ncbi:hypothetical protein [Chryseobacterium sp. 52]|uniref:hypothetical protein n=1 Tax=Chryseobacterium sp. 52 TaxID=2035213 RepID=UPI000C182513|nr:hypothetical protein [Chryseobacterium sp. 52]
MFHKFIKDEFKVIKYKIGYAQVSTKHQNLDLQIEALEKAGCEKNDQEKIIAPLKNERWTEKNFLKIAYLLQEQFYFRVLFGH